MKFKDFIRGVVLDGLGDREDRFYWRQATQPFPLPQGAVVCLWQPDGKLGDSLITSILVAVIHAQRPDAHVIVVCSSALLPFWRGVSGVFAAISAGNDGKLEANISSCAKNVDVFISFETFVSIECLRLMKNIRPTVSIGFGVGRYRSFDYSLVDSTYEFPRKNISERIRNLCDLICLEYLSKTDSIFPMVAAEYVRPTASVDGQGWRVFLNVYGASLQRTFSLATVDWIFSVLSAGSKNPRVMLNVPASQRLNYLQQIKSVQGLTVDLLPDGMDVWALMRNVAGSDLIISPDTSIGHIAAVWSKPSVVFFADTHYNPVVWRPMNDFCELVLPQTVGDVNNFDKSVGASAIYRAMNRVVG